MFERFTDRARKALVVAQENAVGMGHSYLGSEHLLFGLIQLGEGTAAVALERAGVTAEAVRAQIVESVGVSPPSLVTEKEALATLGIDLDAVRQRLEEAFGDDALRAEDPSKPPFTPRAKLAVERAVQESDALGHGYVGTEHQLLALLADDGGLARAILETLGVDLDLLRESILELGAFDYLRIRAAEDKFGRMFQLLHEPATGEVVAPIYEDVSREVRQARAREFAARGAATKKFADEFEAAVNLAETTLREHGLSLTESGGPTQ